MKKLILNKNDQHRSKIQIVFSLFLVLFFVLGCRGRLAIKSTIQSGSAYFTDKPIYNLTVINPVFNFLYSLAEDFANPEENFDIVSNKESLNYCKKFYHTNDNLLKREIIDNDSLPNKKNVVIILMESMSAGKMDCYDNYKKNHPYGNTYPLTPFLDSLSEKSVFYSSTYSSGMHTFNGIYSLFTGMPALYNTHMLRGKYFRNYNGLASILKKNAYATMYFTTHDDQFDNVAGFLHLNDLEKIYSEKDFPDKERLSTLGIPDHLLFKHGIEMLNKTKSPFLSVFMTASDHKPYIIPDDIEFTAKNSSLKHRIVEYADWSIRNFFVEAAKTDWYKNTLFVLLADHGAWMVDNVYDLSLYYHHIPFFIYDPSSNIKPYKNDKLASQQDVYPTVLDLLNISYANSGMGINLMKEVRPFVCFTSDDKAGCISKEWFYINRKNGNESLYEYSTKDLQNVLSENRLTADSMRMHLFSLLKASQRITK